MDIILFGGQSNMEGQTECLPEVNPIVEGAFEYRFLTNEIVPLKHPVGEDIEPELEGAYMGHGSLLPDFCRTYHERTGHTVLAVHVSKGATRVDEWLPGTKRYSVALDKILAAKNAAPEPVEHIFYIWLQGESDAIDHVSGEDYLARLITLKDALKEDVGIERFGIIRVGYFTTDVQYDEAIMQAQEKAVELDPDFLMLTRLASKLSLDPEYTNPEAWRHYNNRAMTVLGEAAGAALADSIQTGRTVS